MLIEAPPHPLATSISSPLPALGVKVKSSVHRTSDRRVDTYNLVQASTAAGDYTALMYSRIKRLLSKLEPQITPPSYHSAVDIVAGAHFCVPVPALPGKPNSEHHSAVKRNQERDRIDADTPEQILPRFHLCNFNEPYPFRSSLLRDTIFVVVSFLRDTSGRQYTPDYSGTAVRDVFRVL